MRSAVLLVVLAWIAPPVCLAAADGSPAEDLKIDRERVFEFAKEPTLVADGDEVTISFETKSFCDVSVAVELSSFRDTSGQRRIVRHLAYGVLGPNAPEPFAKNSKKQTLVWDGKDDTGKYVDNKDDLVVRVSLGLKPRLERNLLWHPKKRMTLTFNPLLVAQPEGVYVYDGAGVENIRLFDHNGRYLRTVYPWPAADAPKVKGLLWTTFADGHRSPTPFGTRSQQAYLYSGIDSGRGAPGSHAVALAVHQGSIAVVGGQYFDGAAPHDLAERLCRLGVGDALGKHELYGPRIGSPIVAKSAAFSPDKKWLYLTGTYAELQRGKKGTGGQQAISNAPNVNNHGAGWAYAVYRMEFDGDKPATVWLGEERKRGKDDKHFDYPTSVCVDAKGRVYISDHFNDRVQIFSPQGKLLKSVPVLGPAVVQIHHKTQELYVFSWNMRFAWPQRFIEHAPRRVVKPHLSIFKPFESTKRTRVLMLPMSGSDRDCLMQVKTDATRFRATLDSWTDPPTLWMCAYHPSWGRGGASPRLEVSRFRVDEKKVVLLERWNDEVQKTIKEWAPRVTTKRRMRADPRTGHLYVESPGGKKPDGGSGTFDYLARIDPATGEVKMVHLPFSAEDFAIDNQGHIYLRACKLIGRYDLDNMREIPFDYGERRSGRYYNSGDRAANLTAGLVLPGTRGPGWWEGGMDVNSLGQIVVAASNDGKRGDFKRYRPRIYPGRFISYEIHVFDKHGKILYEDAIRGVPEGYGTFIDNRSNIYHLSSGPRIYPDGKAWLKGTGCVMKFKPGKGTFYASSGGAVALSDRPVEKLPKIDHRPNRVFYIEGAEWIFPGAGFAPVKTSNAFPCGCWNMRFAVDDFGRSFVPQHRRDQVAVLDTNGNLVLQIGRYGNMDDGLPLHPWKDRRAKSPRTIGGDEVSLCYAHFVGTHRDRYLFIYDGMNDCIKSVKLGYHVDRRIPLTKAKDTE
jgi:hypothetical protein